jgi:hypothetical protein
MKSTCSISITAVLACGLLLSTSAGAASNRPITEQSKSTALPSLEMCNDFFGIETHKGSKADEASGSLGAKANTTGENVTCSRFTDLCLAAEEVAHCQQMIGPSPHR